MASLFRAYDVRGKVPEELNERVAERIGRAFGQFTDANPIAIGRDVRQHSFKLFQSFAKGLIANGKDIIDLGQVPTPLVAYWMRKQGLNGGAMITASHNPQEYNGIKFRGDKGKAFTWESGISQIQHIYQQLETNREARDKEKLTDKIRETNPLQQYLEDMREKISLSSPVKVVIDCSNGTAGLVAPQLFESLGIDTITLNQTPDGRFPTHPPYPAHPQAVKTVEGKVTATGADLGIIYDGDGDRALFVDEKGNVVSSGQSLMILARDLFQQQNRKGKVIFDVTMSEAVPEYVRELGGEPVISRTGNSYFAEKIDDDASILLGAESSGHIFLPTLGVPYDDGIFASARFSAVVSRLRSLAKMRKQLPSYHTSEEKRISCPEDRKEKVIKEVKEHFKGRWKDIFELDGIKIILDSGWFLLRPSNTEPKLSLRAEAETKQDMEAIRDEVMTEIKRNLA